MQRKGMLARDGKLTDSDVDRDNDESAVLMMC